MLSLEQLITMYRGDLAAVQRRLEIDARLTLLRFAPAPARPRSLDWRTIEIDLLTEHLAAMIKVGAITRDQADRELARVRARSAAHLRGSMTPARGR